MILLVSLAIMFEIVAKDGIGRIGKLHTPHGAVKTPTLLPVVNPRVHKMPIESNRLRAFGAEMLITNSYLIFRDPVLSQKAREEGIHRLLGFDGPIMSDSGAFQMMTYGEVSVTNRQITAFQEDIGVDAGVYLDIPLAKGSQQEFEKALALTLERGDENIACRREGTPLLWVGPVQGGPFPELVAAAAKAMSERQFSIYALGSVVPLLESYEY
jgi:7-cyano-7-deazaguanine tRNA-ribosyltransferase